MSAEQHSRTATITVLVRARHDDPVPLETRALEFIKQHLQAYVFWREVKPVQAFRSQCWGPKLGMQCSGWQVTFEGPEQAIVALRLEIDAAIRRSI